MSAQAGDAISEEMFLGRVEQLCATAPNLTPLGASVLVALHLGICSDSRTFARLFGIAHAIVLRELTELAEERGLVEIVDRNVRTQRTAFTLADTARTLLSRMAWAAD